MGARKGLLREHLVRFQGGLDGEGSPGQAHQRPGVHRGEALPEERVGPARFKNRLMWVGLLVSLVLFSSLLKSLDVRKTLNIIGHSDWLLLTGGLAMTSLEALCKSLKLRVLVATQARLSLAEAAAVYLIGIPFGAVTPGKVGDLLKLYSLSQKTSLKAASCLAIGLVERLMDLGVLVLLGAMGVLMLIPRGTGPSMALFFVLAALAALGVLVLALNEGGSRQVLVPLYHRLCPKASREGLRSGLDDFCHTLSLIRRARARLVLTLVLALGASLVMSLRAFLLGAALGLHLEWFYFIFLIPAMIIVEVLPISVLGLGSREYAAILFLGFLGVEREQAVSLSLLSFVCSLVPLALTGYAVAWKEQRAARRTADRFPMENPWDHAQDISCTG